MLMLPSLSGFAIHPHQPDNESLAQLCMTTYKKKKYDAKLHAWLRIDRPKQTISSCELPNSAVAVTHYCQADTASTKIEPTGNGCSIIQFDFDLMDSTATAVTYGKFRKRISINLQVDMLIPMPCHLLNWENPETSGEARVFMANNLTLQPRNSQPAPIQ
jgi:hypothetical protein